MNKTELKPKIIQSMLNELIDKEQYGINGEYSSGSEYVVDVSDIQALITSLDGMSLVPDEPTEEMIDEAADIFHNYRSSTALGEILTGCYKAMINTTRDKDQ